MIKETPNINQCIANERNTDILFDTLRVTFSSSSLKKINALGSILESDGLSFIIKRTAIWRWKLITDIPVVTKYNEQEYRKIMGKFLYLASHCYVRLGSYGLIG